MSISKGLFHKNGHAWQPTDEFYDLLKPGAYVEVRNIGSVEFPSYEARIHCPESKRITVTQKRWKSLQVAKDNAVRLAWINDLYIQKVHS